MYRIFSWRRWRTVVPGAIATVAVAAGLFAGLATPRRAVSANAEPAVLLPILMYHGVLPQPERQGQYVVSPALLEADLRWLQENGYKTVVMQQLIDYVQGEGVLPEKPVLLTFDDGYYNNYLYAYPLLRQYGMQAVISPVVSWSEKFSREDADHEIYSHITWDEMREMVNSGAVEIQNHSYDMHYCTAGKRKGILKQASETAAGYRTSLRADLERAQQVLEQELGRAPTTFTYPYGAMCAEAETVIRELGFHATLSCESRINFITKSPDCLMALGRYLRPAGISTAAFMKKLEDAMAKAAE